MGRHKLIIGLDYGTTFTGVSYVTTNQSGIDAVTVIHTWPGHPGVAYKVPTRIAYAKENPTKIERDEWGYNARPGLKSYNWTKLLLDGAANNSAFDDEALKDLFGSGLMSLPRNKTAKGVCEDYLRKVYAHVEARIKKDISSEMFDVTPIECWVTVPANWQPQAQIATERAAQAAGFGARPGDSVHIIPEPQAAALAALKPYMGSDVLDPLKAGENILICDCGGGTVDITTYTINSCHPVLDFEELCEGTMAKCGSTSIDRDFHKWMMENFGSAYTRVDPRLRGPGSKFMDCFESSKKTFDDSKNLFFEISPIQMSTTSSLYDSDEASVTLSSGTMKYLFEPSVNNIMKLVESQIRKARSTRSKSIDRIILVGGYGDSMYLYNKMKEWCQRNGAIRLICPSNCQSAVVVGAALRGLEGTRPTRAYVKFHYGYACILPFREGIDDESLASWSDWDGRKECNTRVTWYIDKGSLVNEVLSRNYNLTQTLIDGTALESCLKLYITALDHPPEYCTDSAVVEQGTVVTRFDAGDTSKAGSRWNDQLQKEVRRFDYSVQTHLEPDDNLMSFTTVAYGKESGSAQFVARLD